MDTDTRNALGEIRDRLHDAQAETDKRLSELFGRLHNIEALFALMTENLSDLGDDSRGKR